MNGRGGMYLQWVPVATLCIYGLERTTSEKTKAALLDDCLASRIKE